MATLTNMKLTVIFTLISTVVGLLLPPSQDPFYVPPDGYESLAPGAIIRSRPLPSQLRALIVPAHVKGSWQVLVRSTDALGNASAIVSTILEPYNADPNKFISYQIMQDSPSPDCSVSYVLQEGSPTFLTLLAQADMLILQTYLEQGWYVVTPDYEGTTAAFTVGLQAAYGTLDSLRATLGSGSLTGISSNAKGFLFGYSGGALASAWAATYQNRYAPELKPNLLGLCVGGFVTDVRAVAKSIEGGVFAGLTADAMVGWTRVYPGLLEEAKSFIRTPEQYQKLVGAGDQCLITSLLDFAFTKFFTGDDSYFPDGYALFDNPTFKGIIEENTLSLNNTGDIPQIPVFVFHSKNDEIAPWDSAMRVYNNWCSWGIGSFEFNSDSAAEHLVEIATGCPAGFAWMKKLFNGGKPIVGCKSQWRLSNIFYPGALLSFGEEIFTALKSGLQFNLGPHGSLSLILHLSNPFGL